MTRKEDYLRVETRSLGDRRITERTELVDYCNAYGNLDDCLNDGWVLMAPPELILGERKPDEEYTWTRHFQWWLKRPA
tara:strand:+ start:165 stop:398 length:234 start_codon:yes stop_codon:yes gene_type:complete